jgi:hypothetical protein
MMTRVTCCLRTDPQRREQDFARKYKKDINANPVFRNEFQKMCRQIGEWVFTGLCVCVTLDLL